MKTYFILEGLFEGPAHSKQLRNELSRLGYRPAKTAEVADIIITHSGGWAFLPPLNKKPLLILLDPSYRTDRSFRVRIASRLLYDLAHPRLHMAVERLWNSWYFIMCFRKWLALNTLVHKKSILPYLSRSRTIVIGVSDRTWWHEPTMKRSEVRSARLDGDHDAIWSATHYLGDLIKNYDSSERV